MAVWSHKGILVTQLKPSSNHQEQPTSLDFLLDLSDFGNVEGKLFCFMMVNKILIHHHEVFVVICLYCIVCGWGLVRFSRAHIFKKNVRSN